MLDILMMHLRDQRMIESLDKEESDQIARTLTAFSLLLPEETPQPWPRYCGAIGMCYRYVPWFHLRHLVLTIFSALMTLHQSRQNQASTLEVGDSQCPESLASALNRINFISAKFNNNIDQVDFEAISPFPPRGLAKASSIQYRLWKETGERKWLHASDAMILMLTYFSKRWMNAGMITFY